MHCSVKFAPDIVAGNTLLMAVVDPLECTAGGLAASLSKMSDLLMAWAPA